MHMIMSILSFLLLFSCLSSFFFLMGHHNKLISNFLNKKTCHLVGYKEKIGIYTQISEDKYQTESVRKYLILQVDFASSNATYENFASSNVTCENFASYEIVLQLISSLSYSDSFPLSISQVGKISQVGFHNLQNCWMVDFFCDFLSCILVWLWQRVMKLQSLVSSWIWASTCFAMNYTKMSLILGLLWWQKTIKTPKLNTIWLETIARVLSMPIELKGNNYYWKVFKRVNYKL